MKQIRKISNLVAEELQDKLNEAGIVLDDKEFESRVSDVVAKLNESVCGAIEEDIFVEDVFFVNTEVTVGGVAVVAGDYIEVLELDMDEDFATVAIYDENGEVKAEEVTASYAELDTILSGEGVEPVEVGEDGEEEEADEAVHFKGGKKIKISAAIEKLKKKLAAKKSSGVNKFTLKDGKIVKKTSAQIAADKKKSKTFGNKMKKFAKKRAKSLRKSIKLNSGAELGSKKVVEGFDVIAGGQTIALESGDLITITDGMMEVVREGKVIASEVSVDSTFMTSCIEEGVVAEVADTVVVSEEKTEETVVEKTEETVVEKTEEKVEEGVVASMLTYNVDRGYVLVKEGSEIPMGNRVRARAFLRNSGFNVSAEALDKASSGELVIL